MQSRATASQAEKKTRQLEKVIDDGEQKMTELLDELKEAHDEERRTNAELTKLRLQLDETNSATDFAKKDCKKLAGMYTPSRRSTSTKFCRRGRIVYFIELDMHT